MSNPEMLPEEVFEDDYTLKFKRLVLRRGLLVSFDRDRARVDIGIMFNRLGTLELSGTRVWFQLKGVHASTLSAEQLAADGFVSRSLRLKDLRFWYAAAEATYLVIYIEATGQFLAEDVRDIVDREWGPGFLAPERFGDQQTVTVRVSANAVLDGRRLDAMVAHRSMRIDGPAFRGRPLGHRLDPLRCEFAQLDPDVFERLVQALLDAHLFRDVQFVDPSRVLANVGPAGHRLQVLVGTLHTTYEYPFAGSIEYGFDVDTSEPRSEGQLFSAIGKVAVVVHSQVDGAIEAAPMLPLLLSEWDKAGVKHVLVFSNESDMTNLSHTDGCSATAVTSLRAYLLLPTTSWSRRWYSLDSSRTCDGRRSTTSLAPDRPRGPLPEHASAGPVEAENTGRGLDLDLRSNWQDGQEYNVGEPAIRPCTESEFEAVVRLGDRYKRYLGLYPREAYLVSIRAGCIYGAFYQDELVGYVLFALPYADVRLIHLCVDPGYRNAGLARRLIDEIQKRHGDRQGIRLKCRRDYPAHKVWPRLGFQAESLTQGRGKDKAEMTVWRRSFGHADLFSSWLADDPRVQVALDTNVIMDVLLRRNQETEEFLDSPVLQGEVSYCISRSVRNELSELQPPSERRRVMSRLAQFEELSSELRACDTLHEEFVQGLSSVDLAKDHSLWADARLLAETIVSGASVLVTRDDNAATLLRPLAQQHGVDILHPSQLILMIDELKGVRRDGTERLQNTELTLGGASAGIDRELDHLVSTHSGETKSQFRKIVRSKMASDMQIVHTAESRLADGVVVTNTVNGSLEVELLRVRRTPLGAALLKQLLFQLRHEAMSRGASRIVLTDPAPGGGESYVGILEQEGAKLINGCWTIEVVDVQLDLSVLRAGLSPWNLSAWLDGGLETPEDFATLEHQLWPLKVRSAPLHCYVVPIKQSFASELLGYDAPLLTRRRDLGISRRHVYYKSAPYKPAAPGRILWYVSGRRGGSIVASSQLISSHRGSPGALHKRFHKYGVWTQTDIEAHATRTGEAVALRFGDTEIFRSFIKLSDADAIVSAHGRALSTVPTVREIPDAAFHEIYSRGMNQ